MAAFSYATGAVAQYKALIVDYENDEIGTADYLLYDTTTHGPVLGFVFRF
jgi:hypothetical protein